MKYYKDIQKNGLRLITVPMEGNNTVTMAVIVGVGSYFEDKKLNGISHFLEHMCFKGTTNRKGTEINYEFDAMGASNNAFTWHEYTGYHAKAHYSKLSQIADLLADMYKNSTFPQEEIDKERGVIEEEINMYQDNPRAIVSDVWDELLFPNQPAGRDVLGTKESLKNINHKQFVDYRNKYYVSKATTIVLAGNITRREANKIVKEHFSDIKTGSEKRRPKVKVSQKRPAVSVRYKKTDQAHLLMGFRTCPKSHKDQAALTTLKTVLGSGMSSRLFTLIREEMGAAYYSYSTNHSATDHGHLTAAAGLSLNKLDDVIEAVLGEFTKLKTELVGKKELKKAKEHLLGNFAMSLETSDSLAFYYGLDEVLHQELKKPNAQAAEIKKVTSEDIRRVAKKYFKPESLNLALVGPFKDDKRFRKLLRKF